jgi:phenylalanyl-tRNA synthetase alpha chain
MSAVVNKIQQYKEEFLKEIAQVSDSEALLSLKIKYTGRKKGVTKELVDLLKSAPREEKPAIGQEINTFKNFVEASLKNKEEELLNSCSNKQADFVFEASLPGTKPVLGANHPLTVVRREIEEIFEKIGFDIIPGPEVETDFYNFEALGLSEDHPARDTQDTFYISEKVMLRTHTSNVQIHYMETHKPPFKVIMPGRVYRKDADITHSPMFHQIEGLVVGENITFADLKGTLDLFLKKLFGEHTKIRLRPSFFPFTEPSAEVDVTCIMCNGKGCRMCKNSGWLEILGSGMVDPVVFSNVGYDSEKLTGFAFGVGVERVAMLKYGISDIRLFFDNDLRFLKQFK